MSLRKFCKTVAGILKQVDVKIQTQSTYSFGIPSYANKKRQLIAMILNAELKRYGDIATVSYDGHQITVTAHDQNEFLAASAKIQQAFTQDFYAEFKLTWEAYQGGMVLIFPQREWMLNMIHYLVKDQQALKNLNMHQGQLVLGIHPDSMKERYHPILWGVGLPVESLPIEVIKEKCQQIPGCASVAELTEEAVKSQLESYFYHPEYDTEGLRFVFHYQVFAAIANQALHFKLLDIPEFNLSFLMNYDVLLEHFSLPAQFASLQLLTILSKDVSDITRDDITCLPNCFRVINQIFQDEKQAQFQQHFLVLMKGGLFRILFHLENSPALTDEGLQSFYQMIDQALKLCRRSYEVRVRCGFINVPYENLEIAVLFRACQLAAKHNDTERLSYYCSRAVGFKKAKHNLSFNEKFMLNLLRFDSFYQQCNVHHMLFSWEKLLERRDKMRQEFSRKKVRNQYVATMGVYYQFKNEVLTRGIKLIHRLIEINRPEDAYAIYHQLFRHYSPEVFRRFLVDFKPVVNKKTAIERKKDVVTSVIFAESDDMFPERNEFIHDVSCGDTQRLKKASLPHLEQNYEQLVSLLPTINREIFTKFKRKINVDFCEQLGFHCDFDDEKNTVLLRSNDALLKACQPKLNKRAKAVLKEGTLHVTKLAKLKIQAFYQALRTAAAQVANAKQHEVDVPVPLLPYQREYSLAELLSSYRQHTKVKATKKVRSKPSPKVRPESASTAKHPVIHVDFNNGLYFDNQNQTHCPVVALYNDAQYKFGTYFAYLDPNGIPDEYFKKCHDALRNRGENLGLIVPPKGSKGTKFFKKAGVKCYKIKIMKNVFAVGTISENVIYDCDGLPRKAFLIRFDHISDHNKEVRKAPPQVQQRLN